MYGDHAALLADADRVSGFAGLACHDGLGRPAPFRRKIERLIAAAISIRLMEEKFHAKILIHNMATKEPIIIALESFILFIFFIMVKAASTINRPTAILMPLNAFEIKVSSRKLSKNIEIR